MRTYKENNSGRPWMLSITPADVEAAYEATGVDLHECLRDPAKLEALLADSGTLTRLIYGFSRDVSGRHFIISEADFFELCYGAMARASTTAFLEELQSYRDRFPLAMIDPELIEAALRQESEAHLDRLMYTPKLSELAVRPGVTPEPPPSPQVQLAAQLSAIAPLTTTTPATTAAPAATIHAESGATGWLRAVGRTLFGI